MAERVNPEDGVPHPHTPHPTPPPRNLQASMSSGLFLPHLPVVRLRSYLKRHNNSGADRIGQGKESGLVVVGGEIGFSIVWPGLA